MKKLLVILLVSLHNMAFAVNTSTIVENSSDIQLMKMFWECHTLSDNTEKKGVNPFPSTHLEVCAQVSKQVQVRFFNDDFGKMHLWTRKNYDAKPIENIVSK